MKLLPLLFSMTALAFGQTAETYVYRALLSPQNEVPPITDVNASGQATVLLHVVRSATGEIQSGSADFQVNYTFPSGVTLTGLHIHSGAAGTNGPVRINSALTNTEDADGAGRLELQGQVAEGNAPGLAAIAGILQDPSQYYVNLHTSANPNGVIRGQMVRAEVTVLMGVMTTANEVPPIANYEASAVGAVTVIATRGANNAITSGEVIFDVNYTFPTAVTFTGLHVHTGVAGANGPVTLNSGLQRGPSSDSGTGTIRMRNEISVANPGSVAALDGVFKNPAGYYINLHTTDYPNGVVRAQLRPTDRMVFPVMLSTANEVPAVEGLNASGIANVDVRTLRNGDGSVQAGFVVFDVNHRFPGETIFRGLHVHNGAAGNNGPVRLDSGLTGTNTRTSASGAGNIYESALITNANGIATLNSLVSTPEMHYLNLHTSVHPNGAVRGQTGTAPAGAPAIGAVVNAAEVRDANGAPWGLVSIYGANFGSVPVGIEGWAGSTLPTSLNGVQVMIGGRPAPLVFVSPTQVNAQVPAETGVGPQNVTVSYGGATSAAFSLPILAASPGVFQHPGGGIVLKNSDFSLLTPFNPAVTGDILLIYLTGLGQTTPAVTTGQPAPGAPFAATVPVTVTIEGKPAEVIYSIASPGFVGLYQTAVKAPLLEGHVADMVVTVGGRPAMTVTIPTDHDH